jgi:hypothetical protein
MQVRDIITDEYEGAKFTVVNVGSVFIILMHIDGNLHRGHIVATRTFTQRLLGKDYTKKQLDDIAKYCVGVAQATIDTVRNSKKKPK